MPIWIQILTAAIIGAAIIIALILSSRDGRQFVIRQLYLIRHLVGVEVGVRGAVQLALYSALPAVIVAYTQGSKDAGNKGFDWNTFWTVFLVVTIVSVVTNIINSSMNFKRVLSPGAGRVWRAKRKSATAAIIQRINRLIQNKNEENIDTNPEDVRKIIRDLLDIIVLHVRDHRGSFREDRPEVFGNLLIEDGADLVVIARDSFSHKSEYQRPIPVRYPKATLLCGRAIETKKVLSVGVVSQAYPEGPKCKPYQSILAVPLFGTGTEIPYGVLSIDCSRPYFFESFVPGQAENDLENSLQTYAHLITLSIETLISSDHRVVVSKLTQAPGTLLPHGGQP